jgi:hypothetical protein
MQMHIDAVGTSATFSYMSSSSFGGMVFVQSLNVLLLVDWPNAMKGTTIRQFDATTHTVSTLLGAPGLYQSSMVDGCARSVFGAAATDNRTDARARAPAASVPRRLLCSPAGWLWTP